MLLKMKCSLTYKGVETKNCFKWKQLPSSFLWVGWLCLQWRNVLPVLLRLPSSSEPPLCIPAPQRLAVATALWGSWLWPWVYPRDTALGGATPEPRPHPRCQLVQQGEGFQLPQRSGCPVPCTLCVTSAFATKTSQGDIGKGPRTVERGLAFPGLPSTSYPLVLFLIHQNPALTPLLQEPSLNHRNCSLLWIDTEIALFPKSGHCLSYSYWLSLFLH